MSDLFAKGEHVVATGRWLAKGRLPRLVLVTTTAHADCSFPCGRDEAKLAALFPEGRSYDIWIGPDHERLSMATESFGSLADAEAWVGARLGAVTWEA